MPRPAPAALALLAFSALAAAAAPAPEVAGHPDAYVLAGPGGWTTNYVTPAAAVPPGGWLRFVNGDIFTHDVVAWNAFGPPTQAWCWKFPAGKCPLFWSPIVGLGAETDVQGLENLAPLTVYTFYCTLHPNNMRGTLVAGVALPES